MSSCAAVAYPQRETDCLDFRSSAVRIWR